MDAISSKGYGYGYIGSVFPFLVIIGLILSAGLADGLPVTQTKIGFVIVAVWWLLFSLPAMKNIKQVHYLPPSKLQV